jgi:hypothetical protein
VRSLFGALLTGAAWLIEKVPHHDGWVILIDLAINGVLPLGEGANVVLEQQGHCVILQGGLARQAYLSGCSILAVASISPKNMLKDATR